MKTKTRPSSNASSSNRSADPATTVSVLREVQRLVDRMEIDSALALVTGHVKESPAIRNARAVCHLRMHRIETAEKILRDLVYSDGPFGVPAGTPTVFQTNLATAFLLAGKTGIALTLLNRIDDAEHPAVVELKEAVATWKARQPGWRRMLMWIGTYPAQPIPIEFKPGRVWIPEGEEDAVPPTRRAA